MEAQILAGKTAIVTGASQGIGLASACALARDGASIVIMARNKTSLVKAHGEIVAQAPGARVEIFEGDACSEEAVIGALAFAHSLGGRLDIIAATVGAPTFMPILMRDLEGVQKELEINFISAFLAVRHGVPLMGPGGTIVCVSSTGSTASAFGLAVYGAAKAALERFVRAAAFELGGAGIRINAVRPGMTLPKERAAQPELVPMVKSCAAETPLGRIGEPEDIARVVRFLAGPESGWVTGQSFSVDGGQDQGKGPDMMDAYFGKEVMDRIRAGKAVDRPA